MPITSFLQLLKPGSASKARLCQHFKDNLCQHSNKKTGKVFKIQCSTVLQYSSRHSNKKTGKLVNYHLPHKVACYYCRQPTTMRSDNLYTNAYYFIPIARTRRQERFSTSSVARF